MGEIVDSVESSAFADREGAALERRLLRAMYVVLAVALAASLVFAPWRVTTGLLLGGVLSLFNHHWLRGSLAAVFGGQAAAGRRPRLSAARYVLRYFVIACVVASAYALNLISVPATLGGLCAFAAAVMVEAFTQLYFAIIRREEF
jgi:FtsH-binding integral membrane protein